jgi:hypothetical protein
MSTNIAPIPIRLLCNLDDIGPLQDINNALAVPLFVRGDDIEIDIGLAIAGALITGMASGGGAGNIASITCQLFASENDTNAAMLSQTIGQASINFALTQLNWNAGGSGNSHAQFKFTAAQTNFLIPNGQDQVQLWLRIYITTGDATAKQITCAGGGIIVKDAPLGVPGSALTGGTFRQFVDNGGTLRFQIQCADGTWHSLGVILDGPNYALFIDQTPY